jgi:putative PIN family toxin of toxin-antitoxin system
MFVVIDTNVIVSSFISHDPESPPVRVINALMDRRFIPLHNPEIIAEYEDVLHRSKFHFNPDRIRAIINHIKTEGLEIFPSPTGEILPDPSDLIFYEVTMEQRSQCQNDGWLVTGNTKHYPARCYIMKPYDFMVILDNHGKK